MSNNVINTYAAYYKNENIRLDSSSGGIFSVIANRILGLNGLVYGVAMTSDCKGAEFIRVSSSEMLYKLRGSKYMQAKLGRTFTQVKEDLQNDRYVLFTGTFCHINGLKKFLSKEYENLICIDVICHGAASPALWEKYVNHIQHINESELINVNFRNKDNSWIDFGIKTVFSNGKERYMSKDSDSYMQMFLRDYCLRPSCYKCIAKENKMADMTIADFWGIDHILPQMNDGKGVSLVLTRSLAGEKLFNEISNDIIYQKVSYEDGVKGNPSEYKSVTRPKERDVFFEDMKALNFEELEKKYASPIKISFTKQVKRKIKNILLKIPIKKIFT